MAQVPYIRVASSAESDEIMEIPVEPENFISMTMLNASFPIATGLKYQIGRSWRFLRVAEGRVNLAVGETWSAETLYVTTVNTS
jgi:hypothetical protein